jgi:hypothetical protein
MIINLQGKELIETPTGKGRVFKRQKFVAEVVYELQTFLDKNKCSTDNPIVTGRIKRVDNANIFWRIEQHILFLQDNRKLDFICVDYGPDCKIISDTGFYV